MRIHAALKERNYETLTARNGEDVFITAVILASSAGEPGASPGPGDLYADTLRKPIDTDELLSKVEKHLGDR